MSEILECLFGSRAKTRIIRFFLLNPVFEGAIADIAKRNLLKSDQVKKEIGNLRKMGFLLEKNKKNKKYYQFNQQFPFTDELKNLVVKSNVYPKSHNLKNIKNIGDVRLAAVSGVFLNYPKSKADLILVVNNFNRGKLHAFISNLEAEIGREINYVLMNGDEFKYRLNMLDRFLIDFFENPHDEIVNKIPGFKRALIGIRK